MVDVTKLSSSSPTETPLTIRLMEDLYNINSTIESASKTTSPQTSLYPQPSTTTTIGTTIATTIAANITATTTAKAKAENGRIYHHTGSGENVCDVEIYVGIIHAENLSDIRVFQHGRAENLIWSAEKTIDLEFVVA
jgi:hypothetical protein